MLTNESFLAAILVMTGAAFATRVAGAVLMSRVKPTRATDRFLEGMSASVIAALVASLVAQASSTDIMSVVVAVAVTLTARSVIWSMLAGMVCAAGLPRLILLWY